MPYVGILLVTILIAFTVVRIGAFALQLTGIEPSVAKFQALSAFSGTGFTTTEAERVVRHRSRRRIITILIILGNAGLVTIIATLVASFTQVAGYGWFFIRLAVIIFSIFVLYHLLLRSKAGSQIVQGFRKPLMRHILGEAPTTEEIFSVGKDWGVSLVMIEEKSRNIGLSLADATAEVDIQILAIERVDASLASPDKGEKLLEGDRLLVYGSNKAVRRVFGQ